MISFARVMFSGLNSNAIWRNSHKLEFHSGLGDLYEHWHYCTGCHGAVDCVELKKNNQTMPFTLTTNRASDRRGRVVDTYRTLRHWRAASRWESLPSIFRRQRRRRGRNFGRKHVGTTNEFILISTLHSSSTKSPPSTFAIYSRSLPLGAELLLQLGEARLLVLLHRH